MTLPDILLGLWLLLLIVSSIFVGTRPKSGLPWWMKNGGNKG